jgi:hypothetical protein
VAGVRYQLNPQLTPLPRRQAPAPAQRLRLGLGDAAGDLAKQAQAAALQAAMANAPASAQQAWSQATGGDANAGRISSGVSAASSLVQNGYDQNNPEDEKKLVAAIAAGVSLIPVWGPVFAGALETLNEIAVWVGGVLQDIGLIPKPGCKSSGTFTTQNVLSDWVSRGADVTPGTFGAIAWPALAHNTALFRNCQKGGFDNETLLTALVNVWNSAMTGPGRPVYTPKPFGFGDPFGFSGQGGGPLLANNRGGIALPLAAVFHPASDFPGGQFPVGADATSTLTINGATAAATAAPGATATSKGATAGGLAAAGVVGTVVYSYVTGKAVGAVLEHAMVVLTGLFE